MLRDDLLFLGHNFVAKRFWIVAPLSWIYAFVIYLRNKCYDLHLFKQYRAKTTVVSVGNILAGGTGKTPFVHLLASSLPHLKIAILSRGFGKVPDEALLLAKRLPQVKVFVGKNRSLLAKRAAQEADLVILDDGFQHRRLARDLEIVLIREGKEHYLPWGFLRDSPKRLQKADILITAEKDFALKVKRILDLKGNEIASIRGWKVAIFCGIAHPELFKKTVQDLGAEIVGEKYFADHATLDLSTLPEAEAYLCTEKDAVKLSDEKRPIYFLQMQAQWIGDPMKWENLIEKINQKIDNQSTYERSCKN